MAAAETSRYYQSSDGLRLFYRDFAADSAGVPVICLPGLTRNSRDFIDLAMHLSAGHRVLAPDLRGRGFSARDPDWRNYHPGTYVKDVWTLLDLLHIKKIVVIGTSLGGLMAMLMAFQDVDRISGVVLNDIGPEVAAAGLKRIQTYTGRLPPVASWQEATAQTREVYGTWLPGLSDVDWQKMAWRAYRSGSDGVPVLDMDPEIGTAVREVGPQAGDPWPRFDALIKVPALVLRGALSDVLSPEILQKMYQRKQDLISVEIADRGHVPLLNEPAALAAIDAFLRGIDS